jgi:hypothetical protein
MIWPAAGAAHGVHGVTSTDLRDNENKGELHAYLQARGGGSRRSGLRWEQRRIRAWGLLGRPGGQVRWVTGETRVRVARSMAHLLHAATMTALVMAVAAAVAAVLAVAAVAAVRRRWRQWRLIGWLRGYARKAGCAH